MQPLPNLAGAGGGARLPAELFTQVGERRQARTEPRPTGQMRPRAQVGIEAWAKRADRLECELSPATQQDQ